MVYKTLYIILNMRKIETNLFYIFIYKMAYASQSHASQSHALPNRALLLINEYSKPITRPDWRKSKPIITTYCLYLIVKTFSYKKLDVSSLDRLYLCISCNITDTDWYDVYVSISFYGLNNYLERHDTHMTNADGIKDAIQYYNIQMFRSMRGFHP
jgi:hypothetical protein